MGKRAGTRNAGPQALSVSRKESIHGNTNTPQAPPYMEENGLITERVKSHYRTIYINKDSRLTVLILPLEWPKIAMSKYELN